MRHVLAACYFKGVVHARERSYGALGSLAEEVTLRDARPEDFSDLLVLWKELMELHTRIDPRFELSFDADARFETYVETALDRDDYRVRVATLGHRLVGFAISCILPNSPVYRSEWIGYVNDLCVTDSVRRRGVGEKLVHDAVDWLRCSGAESIEVYVAHENHLAQRFWRRIGARDYLDRLCLDLDALDARRD